MASLMEGCWPHRVQSRVESTGVEAGQRTGRQVEGEILNPTLNPIHNLTGSRWLSSLCNAVTFFLPGNLSSSPAYFVL